MKRLLSLLIGCAALAFAQAPKPSMATNIELTVYVVNGFAQAQPGPAEELPDGITTTLKQMSGVFVFKSYKLLSAFTLRGRNFRSAQVAGDLPVNNWRYDFQYEEGSVTAAAPDVVHLNGLRLEVSKRGFAAAAPSGTGTVGPRPVARASNSSGSQVMLVTTDLDVKEGQKTVVGQSAVNGADGLFLVIVARVIR